LEDYPAFAVVYHLDQLKVGQAMRARPEAHLVVGTSTPGIGFAASSTPAFPNTSRNEAGIARLTTLDSYCGDTDQLISSPDLTGNISLTCVSPDPRTGFAWKRTHAAPAVIPVCSANDPVSPAGTRPSGMVRPSFLVTDTSMSSDDRFSIFARVWSEGVTLPVLPL
jgi:hypothetical protein